MGARARFEVESRGREGPRLAVPGGLALLILVFLGTVARAGDPVPPDRRAWLETLAAHLRAGDGPALVALVDFERRHAEGVARGTLAPWESLGSVQRLRARQAAAAGWLEGRRDFLAGSRVVAMESLPDPDAGRGPVPERRHVRLTLSSERARMQLQVVVVTAEDGALLELHFGEPHAPGHDPLGPAGLVPPPLQGALELRWPDHVDVHARAAARELVEALASTRSGREPARHIESLHRAPHAAAAALLERLLEEDARAHPDASLQWQLVDALATITGRTNDIQVARRPGVDPGAWRAGNRACVASWVRWHRHHGALFAAAPVEDPLDPTFDERAGEAPGHLLGTPGAVVTSEGVLPPPPPTRGGSTGAAGGPGGEETSPGAPPGTSEHAPRGGAWPDSLGDRQAWTADGVVPWRSLEASPAARELLISWSGVVQELDLALVPGERHQHLLLGTGPVERLAAASALVDRTAELLAPVLEPSPKSPPLVVFALHSGALGDGRARTLLEALAGRGLARRREVDDLLARPAPLALLREGLLVVPLDPPDPRGRRTLDASDHALVHAAAGLLYTRGGQPPPSFVGVSLGHALEWRVLGRAHVGLQSLRQEDLDHWPRQARGVVRGLKGTVPWKDWLHEREPGEPVLEDVLVSWALLDHLLAERPGQLRSLRAALAGIHADADPFGLASGFSGDAARVTQALEAVLDDLEVETLVDHLRELG